MLWFIPWYIFVSSAEETSKLISSPTIYMIYTFLSLFQDIVDTHPGLTFLKEAPEFHSRYITTVSAQT